MMIDNFIGVFDNALTKKHCEDLIDIYKESEKLNYSVSRKDLGKLKLQQDNNLVFANNRTNIKDEVFFETVQPIIEEFTNLTWKYYADYANKYGVLNHVATHRFYDSIKIQKTKPSEGYHEWHCEHDNRKNGSRLLLVMVYLNDVELGGETEFLYQSKRISPKQGTMVICPSGFTHTHRGNPPLKGEKYMINGWIEYDK
jgi:hypothetical protein